jgi:hypothetical protein
VGEPAAVTFVQRFGGALNLHVHFHAIVAEALFAKDGDAVQESVTAMRVKVDAEGRTLRQLEAKNLNADLTTHADVGTAAAIPLLANEGLASPGFKLNGAGFILDPEEAGKLVRAEPAAAELVRPYRHGRDLTSQAPALSGTGVTGSPASPQIL